MSLLVFAFTLVGAENVEHLGEKKAILRICRHKDSIIALTLKKKEGKIF